MTDLIILPDDLIAVAPKWEKKFQVRNIKSQKIDGTEWDTLSSEIRRLVPPWLIELLASHAVVGPGFKKKPKDYPPWHLGFSFSPIWWYKDRPLVVLDEDIKGFFPISDGQDGDKWLIKEGGAPSMPVYLYSSTGRKIKEIEPSMATFLNHLKLDE